MARFNLAEKCEKQFKKGDEVFIDGELQIRNFGEPKQYITEIKAKSAQFLGKRN